MNTPYRQTEQKNPRASTLPEKITAYLKENPGVQLYRIVEAVGASRGAITYQIRTMTAKGLITYQIRTMTAKGLITVHEETGCRRYYLHTFTYTKDTEILKIFLENNTKTKILRILQKTPALSREELAEKTGIPKNTLYRHLAAMSDAGTLKRKRNGHKWLYSLAEKTKTELKNKN